MFHYVGNLQIITEKHENLLSSCLDKISVLEKKICHVVSSTEIKSSSPITINSSTNKPILHHDSESSQLVLLEQIRAVLQEQAQEEILARSLIINGLQESDNKTDQKFVLDLIHEATSLPLLPTDIESIARLGKKEKFAYGCRPTRIILSQGSKHFCKEIISKSGSLRKSTDVTRH